MKKTFVILVITLTFSTARTEILDQYQEDSDMWGMIAVEGFFAQTFTPGISGQLDHIDLRIGEWVRDPGYPSTVSIVNTAGGLPSGSLLGEVDIPEPFDGWNTIDFLAESVFLSAGTQYSIILSNDDDPALNIEPAVTWRITGTDTYPGGSLWSWRADIGWNQDGDMPTHDFALMDAAFRTYMVPEPATIGLFGLGPLLLRKRQTTNRHNSSTQNLKLKTIRHSPAILSYLQ